MKQKIANNSSSVPTGNIGDEDGTSKNTTNVKFNQPQTSAQANVVNQPIAVSQLPGPINTAQTIIDSNGQQFFLVPAVFYGSS